jgi:hypothetical protein
VISSVPGQQDLTCEMTNHDKPDLDTKTSVIKKLHSLEMQLGKMPQDCMKPFTLAILIFPSLQAGQRKPQNILSNMMAANTQEQNPCESVLSKAE